MNDHQRVITTRWWLPSPLRTRPCPKQPPTSHHDSLVAFHIPPLSTPAKKTTNELFRLVGGFLAPSTLDLAQNNHQRVV